MAASIEQGSESCNEKPKLPGEGYSQNIRARFWITGQSGAYVGIGRIELLEYINQLGSMNRAAKAMGMSYKKAWKLVEELNNMYDEPLVIKEHGGKSGGGTRLTERGHLLITEFRALENDLIAFLKHKSEKIG